MHAGFMSTEMVSYSGDYIGKFIQSDPNNFVGTWRDYLRVRVTIALDKPLKRRMKLRKSADNWCWVNFKYENVLTFCFICGFIGHSEKFCEKLFNTPNESIERPYGVWMRAESKRRNYTMGAQWQKQGGTTPPAKTVSGGGNWIRKGP